MEYTKTYNDLRSIFTTEKEEIEIPFSDIKIHNIVFKSEGPAEEFAMKSDKLISENMLFSYPVFTPANRESSKIILLLHGLNERSWVKYLVWAYSLALNTDSYVILFPISFHINRSPASWKDPRAMADFLKERNSKLGNIEMSSFANIALSARLSEYPMRFFNSGYQTVSDLVTLFKTIKNGDHPIIPKSSDFNIFAYSIGAFLAQIMIMSNPENLFSKSRLFMFCGGSVFSNMQGSSKLIMDRRAFERVYNYFLYDFERTIKGRSQMIDFFNYNKVGMAFRSMIDLSRLKLFRENTLKKLRHQIQSVTLVKDTVIPSEGVVATLNIFKENNIAKVWDFPYTYSHENPFPLLNSDLSHEVDICFEKVFSEAKRFFA